MEKMAWDGPKWGREGFCFPANPDLVDIWATWIWILIILSFFFDYKFLDSQVPRFPKSGLGRAGLEPSGPTNVDFLM